MASRRRKPPDGRRGRPGAETPPPQQPPPEPPVPVPRRLLWTAILLAAAWWCFLAVLAWRTGRPVLLNRQQIAQADFVVTGTVAADGRTVQVNREWKHDAPLERIEVARLDESGARSGRAWLIPLSHAPRGRYEVTGTRLPGGRPLVYPATPEAMEQLRSLLSD